MNYIEIVFSWSNIRELDFQQRKLPVQERMLFPGGRSGKAGGLVLVPSRIKKSSWDQGEKGP